MRSDPYFAASAALIGDPGRANILAALLDGRSRTAKELALIAGVSPQTTSGHLSRLLEGGLIAVMAQGRHRYFRLATPLVAGAIEALMALSAPSHKPHRPLREAERALRFARTCYDHLAGSLGVAILDRLLQLNALEDADGLLGITATGRDLFASVDIDIETMASSKRSFARPCLDWSERRPHLAGNLGAAIACHCFDRGWIEKKHGTRAVDLTSFGRNNLERWLGPLVYEPRPLR